MTDSAAIFVIVFTLLNIVACLWLMWWTAQSRGTDVDTKSTTGHVWDDDLTEYNNPMPRWWLWLFVLTIVFGLGYLAFYPGLGNFKGAGGWSSTEQYHAEQARLDALQAQRLQPLAALTPAELAQNGDAMSLAKNLFSANCAGCHGSDARGAKGYPNLTDDDWLWGKDTVYQSVAAGRQGAMPAWGTILGDEGVNQVTAYVLRLSNRKAPEDWAAAGKARFDTLCIACHGVEGKGMPALGAPNLTDAATLYGGDFESVQASIKNGRAGQMPAHLESLGETKIRLLAAYLIKLTNDRSATATTAAR